MEGWQPVSNMPLWKSPITTWLLILAEYCSPNIQAETNTTSAEVPLQEVARSPEMRVIFNILTKHDFNKILWWNRPPWNLQASMLFFIQTKHYNLRLITVRWNRTTYSYQNISFKKQWMEMTFKQINNAVDISADPFRNKFSRPI
jgi:hypothetical protein